MLYRVHLATGFELTTFSGERLITTITVSSNDCQLCTVCINLEILTGPIIVACQWNTEINIKYN